jgi:hypothetical protein
MRVARNVLMVALVVLTMAVPASAGTRANPEITDKCTGQVTADNNSVQVMHESIDICAVWFQATSGTTPTVKVNLQTRGNLEDRPGGAYWVAWTAGKCSFAAIVDDAVGAEMPQRLSVGCGEPTTRTCTVPQLDLGCETTGGPRDYALPANSVVVAGDELRVTVRFEGALAPFAKAHDAGSVLSDPWAFATQVVGPVYLHTWGCSAGLEDLDHCWGANGDTTATGKDFTVPQA